MIRASAFSEVYVDGELTINKGNFDIVTDIFLNTKGDCNTAYIVGDDIDLGDVDNLNIKGKFLFDENYDNIHVNLFATFILYVEKDEGDILTGKVIELIFERELLIKDNNKFVIKCDEFTFTFALCEHQSYINVNDFWDDIHLYDMNVIRDYDEINNLNDYLEDINWILSLDTSNYYSCKKRSDHKNLYIKNMYLDTVIVIADKLKEGILIKISGHDQSSGIKYGEYDNIICFSDVLKGTILEGKNLEGKRLLSFLLGDTLISLEEC